MLARAPGGAIERASDVRDHEIRLLDQLTPRDSNHLIARILERHRLATIALERLAMAMEGVGVDLEDHPLLGPHEVDLVAGHAVIDRGLWKPCGAEQAPAHPLHFRAGHRWLPLRAQECSEPSASGPPSRPRQRRLELAFAQ